MAVACGLDPACIPEHSIISRFRADHLTPLKSIAIFYFIVLVAITNEIVSNIYCATDSTHLFSYANTYNRYNTCNCEFRSDCCPTCTYDINASIGHKKKDFSFFDYKAHTTVDAISRLILGFFFSPGSANDSPIYIPLQKFVHKILSVKFDVYSADKGYDSTKNIPLSQMTFKLIRLSLAGKWRKSLIVILFSTKMVSLTANIASCNLDLMART
ncbi:MAG: Transposase domain [Petroclostridium sp.]|jgi:hypothetical protein|nr:Transposase domain [Thermoanaerobacter sp.]MDK2811388.1 Transposase domain [Petroclostridium sp.]